jgi:uncharacterized cupredoxin-like copper-binding protein
MSRHRRTLLIVVPLVAMAMVTGVGFSFAGVRAVEGPTLGPGDVTIQVDIHHSRFQPDSLTVVAGTRVRFLVVNDDPIHHELITGGPEVHLRHTDGTEKDHPSIPGEVSVGPNGRAITTFTFDEPGIFEFACHLPGHYQYGMKGMIEVVPATP